MQRTFFCRLPHTSLKKCLSMEVISCGELSERSTCSFWISKAWQSFWMRGLDPLTRYTPLQTQADNSYSTQVQVKNPALITLVSAAGNNTWTDRARLSISDVQRVTTNGTSSAVSCESRERSTPNTVPFLCSHSIWHTSIHFLCKASPHCISDKKEHPSVAVFF